MAEEKKRLGKSESLTIRLDPRMRFIVEFMARANGQTITTVIERALIKAGDEVRIDGFVNGGGTWKSFWDISEGVRALKIASEHDLFPTFEEEQRLSFAIEHWPFFFEDGRGRVCKRPYIEVLWPRIDEFVKKWVTERAQDYNGAARAMQKALKDAGLEPPEWPISEKRAPKGKDSGRPSDLDDDIPF